MNEWRRLIRDGRWWTVLLIALLVNAFLFYHEQENKYGKLTGFIEANTPQLMAEIQDQITEYGKSPLVEGVSRLSEFLSEADKKGEWTLPVLAGSQYVLPYLNYLDSYSHFLDQIQSNADVLTTLSVFGGDTSSFSYRNIRKTAADYSALSGTVVSSTMPYGVEAVMSWHVADMLILAVVLSLCLLTLEDRRRGLWPMMHAARHGVLRLALTRMTVYMVITFLSCFLLYGSTWMMACRFFGTPDYTVAVQSVPALKQMTLPLTLGSFLQRFLLFKTGGMLLIGLLCWFILTRSSTVTNALLIVAAIGTMEYALFSFLPQQSAFNFFKYVNLMSFVFAEEQYEKYLNFNLFGYPVNCCQLLEVFLPLFSLAAFTLQLRRLASYMELRSWAFITRVTDTCFILWDRFVALFMGISRECCKNSLIRGNLFVFLVYFLVVLRMFPVEEFSMPWSPSTEDYYRSVFEGPLTDHNVAAIAEERMVLEKEREAFEALTADHEAGKVTDYEYAVGTALAENTRVKSEALAEVERSANRALSLEKNYGYRAWVLNERYLERLFEDTVRARAEGMPALLLLIITAGTVLAFERESGMKASVRGTARGRGRYIFHQQLLLAFSCLLAAIVLYVTEYYHLTKIYTPSGLEAPVQMTILFERCEWPVSIREMLGIVFGLRYLTIWFAGEMAFWISGLVKNRKSAVVCGTLVIVLPTALWTMDVPFFEYVSFGRILQPVWLLNAWYHDLGWFYLLYGGLLCLGVIMVVLAGRRWCRTPERLERE